MCNKSGGQYGWDCKAEIDEAKGKEKESEEKEGNFHFESSEGSQQKASRAEKKIGVGEEKECSTNS